MKTYHNLKKHVKFDIERYYTKLSVHDKNILGKRADTLARFSQYEIPFLLTLKYVTGKNQILDWGCGNGFYSHFLIRNNLDVVGYGFDEALPLVGENDSRFKYIKGDPSEPVKLPFNNSTFDAVLSVGVLEHVHQIRTIPEGGDQLKSVLEIKRILCDGGYFLIFNLPNIISWSVIKKSSRVKHDKRFNKSAIESLMTIGGMEIIEMGRYGCLPRNATSRISVFQNIFISRVYNLLNNIIESLFPVFATNWYVVARKPISTID